MDIIHLASHGIFAQDIALALTRLTIGGFFAISGFNKLFNTGRHQSLKKNLIKNHIPAINLMQWWVPLWEFVGGLMLAIGLFTAFSAAVLMIICVVAVCCESKKRVEAYGPINFGDRIADYLYLPEVLYMILLAGLLAGTGRYSIDALLWPIK